MNSCETWSEFLSFILSQETASLWNKSPDNQLFLVRSSPHLSQLKVQVIWARSPAFCSRFLTTGSKHIKHVEVRVREMSPGSVTASNWALKNTREQLCCFPDGATEKQTAKERWRETSTFRGQKHHLVCGSEQREAEERWQIDNETAKSLILRIICFFCSVASRGKALIKG